MNERTQRSDKGCYVLCFALQAHDIPAQGNALCMRCHQMIFALKGQNTERKQLNDKNGLNLYNLFLI
jgi:hypothetical protein